MNRNFIRIFTGFILIALVTVLITWWTTRTKPIAPAPQPVVQEPPPTNAIEHPNELVKIEEVTEETTPTPTETAVTAANWEDHLDEILSADNIDTDQKADKIADMIPKLPEPAQKELAEHLVNLISDEFYTKAANILKNEKTPASVSQVLLDDLFNRDQELMLPLTLEVALNEKHPLKAEALQDLEMVVGEDYGTNWLQWSNAVQKILKGEQP